MSKNMTEDELRAACELLGVPLNAWPLASDSRRGYFYTWVDCDSTDRLWGDNNIKVEASSKRELIDLCYAKAIEIAQSRTPKQAP